MRENDQKKASKDEILEGEKEKKKEEEKKAAEISKNKELVKAGEEK